MNDINELLVLKFDYKNTIKYIILSKKNKNILYVYRILYDAIQTELVVYENNSIKDILILDLIKNFNFQNPQKSIDAFYNLYLLK